MAIPALISTGEQSVTATGAVPGTLTTATLTANLGMFKLRIRGLTSGQTIRVALEDTVNATPFTDATTCFVVDTAAGQSPDGNEFSVALNTLPSMRFGVTLSKLRLNTTAISAATTALVEGWIEQ